VPIASMLAWRCISALLTVGAAKTFSQAVSAAQLP
jgi:hypothetical protein